MSEPDPLNKLDSNKKDELMAEFKCLHCGDRIGDVVRLSNRVRILRKDNGETWEGHGGALCPTCGKVRRWIPGEMHIRLITERNKKYQLT